MRVKLNVVYQLDSWAVRRSQHTLSQMVDFFPAGFFPSHCVLDYFNFDGFSSSKGQHSVTLYASFEELIFFFSIRSSKFYLVLMYLSPSSDYSSFFFKLDFFFFCLRAYFFAVFCFKGVTLLLGIAVSFLRESPAVNLI